MRTAHRRIDRGVERISLRAQGLAVLIGATTIGCATATLPVEHVVIFRNGIAYFERGGHVSQDRVRFTVKQVGVSDLLATLSVHERTSSLGDSGQSPARAVHLDPRGGSDSAETVVVSLDGHPHDLTVGYISSCPIWKPSYRLALRGDGKANLQIWGIVENSSGEDWKGVRLSLVSGAPIAYSSDLGSSVTPGRPQFSDRGQETPTIPPGAFAASFVPAQAAARAQRNLSDTQILTAQITAPSSPPPLVDQDASARRRQLELMARSADTATAKNAAFATMTTQGGSTRYDVSAELSLPNESASMVMVADRPVVGELTFFFSPGDSPPFATGHPFRAVRFENRTEGTLEGGPISMFAGDAFLGQAVTETLPQGGSAILPFALERAIEITQASDGDDVHGPLTSGGVGEPTLRFEHRTRTFYRMRNDTDLAVKVIVKHPRAANTRLHAPPEGTEDSALTHAALMPLTAGAHASAELVVDERAPLDAPIDWLAPAADTAVKTYLADPRSDAATVAKLAAAWAIRGDIAKLSDERRSLRMKAYDLGGANVAAKASYERQIKDLDGKITELTAKFEAALGAISMR